MNAYRKDALPASPKTFDAPIPVAEAVEIDWEDWEALVPDGEPVETRTGTHVAVSARPSAPQRMFKPN